MYTIKSIGLEDLQDEIEFASELNDKHFEALLVFEEGDKNFGLCLYFESRTEPHDFGCFPAEMIEEIRSVHDLSALEQLSDETLLELITQLRAAQIRYINLDNAALERYITVSAAAGLQTALPTMM